MNIEAILDGKEDGSEAMDFSSVNGERIQSVRLKGREPPLTLMSNLLLPLSESERELNVRNNSKKCSEETDRSEGCRKELKVHNFFCCSSVKPGERPCREGGKKKNAAVCTRYRSENGLEKEYRQ